MVSTIDFSYSSTSGTTVSIDTTAIAQSVAENFGIEYEEPSGDTYDATLKYEFATAGFYIDTEHFTEYAAAIQVAFEALYGSGKLFECFL